MKKVKKEKKVRTGDGCNVYHAEPRNGLEEYFHSMLPDVIDAYGLGKISFYYMTPDCDQGDIPIKDAFLMIKYDEIYRTAFLTITPNAVNYFKRGELEPLKNGLVHEVGHILTNKLGELALSRHATRKQIKDSIEETTEQIAQITRRLLNQTKGAKLKTIKIK